MKRAKIAILLMACLLLASCAEPTEPIDIGVRETITSEPYPEMSYNGTPIKLKEVKLIQTMTESTRYYQPMLILHFDFSQVEDYQKNRMFETDLGLMAHTEVLSMMMREFEVEAEYNSEQNEVKFKDIPLITHYTDGDEVVYIFYDYESKLRNDLSDIELEFDVNIIQDEKYQKKYQKSYLEYRKTNSYTYRLENLPIQDESVVTQTETDMFAKAVDRITSKPY